MYYGGFTYTEAYNLPVSFKTWFINRIVSEITKSNKGESPPGDRSANNNNAETAALLGRTRSANTPARGRRFT